jgi:hypothetical protein
MRESKTCSFSLLSNTLSLFSATLSLNKGSPSSASPSQLHHHHHHHPSKKPPSTSLHKPQFSQTNGFTEKPNFLLLSLVARIEGLLWGVSRLGVGKIFEVYG